MLQEGQAGQGNPPAHEYVKALECLIQQLQQQLAAEHSERCKAVGQLQKQMSFCYSVANLMPVVRAAIKAAMASMDDVQKQAKKALAHADTVSYCNP